MKTPYEIKKGLECCFKIHTREFEACLDCPFDLCESEMIQDTLAYIQQLERQNAEQAAQLARVTHELHSAVSDLQDVIEAADGVNYCQFCKYNEDDGQCHHPCNVYGGESGWEWRGVPQEGRE